jgi:cytochrome oxidase assembly protein ShyY1
MYFTWFRMPRQEYEMHHKFVPYYMIGQLDYTKEILIPEKKNG